MKKRRQSFEWEDDTEDVERYWQLVDRKDIKGYDGFYTNYSPYCLMPEGEKYVTVYGDPDIYKPEEGDFDAEFDNEDEAWEFFNYYQLED